MYMILSFLGVLYILNIIDKTAYKFFPKLNVSKFFANKLEIYQINSVKDYILAYIRIYTKVKYLTNVNEKDLNNFDLEALSELKQYINSNLKPYIKSLMQNRISTFDNINTHVQYTLEHGIIDFYYSQSNLYTNSVSFKFQSFSEDSPTLEISSKVISYTYRLKSKYVRFVNPDVKLIYEIRDSLKALNQSFLQVA